VLATTIVDLRARPLIRVSRGCPPASNRPRRILSYDAGRRRRARKLANGGTHTLADVLVQYERQTGKCYYCHVDIGQYHVDHRVPLYRGGSDGAENLVCACGPCNLRKHTKTDVEFLALLEVEFDGNPALMARTAD
jgi:5-methylcytosine-specific restriction endonuclease McrA